MRERKCWRRARSRRKWSSGLYSDSFNANRIFFRAIADERRREKQEELEARNRVLEQIRLDKVATFLKVCNVY